MTAQNALHTLLRKRIALPCERKRSNFTKKPSESNCPLKNSAARAANPKKYLSCVKTVLLQGAVRNTVWISAVICGLNGAGKSTLGKALAEALHYRFIDIEDIYFPKVNPDYLYSNPRSFEEVKSILADIVSENDSFVLASVRGTFDEDITFRFTDIIYIEVTKEIRIQRVYNRSYSKFGERMCEGGDLYEKETTFFELVKSRDEDMVEKWLLSVSCPIIRVDGTLPICDNVKRIIDQLQTPFRPVPLSL